MVEKKYWYSNYPYCDFFYISSLTEIGHVSFNLDNHFEPIMIDTNNNSNSVFYYDRRNSLIIHDSTQLLLSGVLKANKRLIWGYEDIVNTDTTEDLTNQIGNYTLVKIESYCIEFSTDYFGLNKIFYYNHNDILIVSNRYELILLVLNKLGISSELNESLAVSYLIMTDISLNQLMTNDTLIQYVKVMDVGNKMLVSGNKVEFVDSEFKKDLNLQLLESENEYYKLLDEASEDIRENLEIVYNSSRFKQIIIDLTGGLDSRIVFSALRSINTNNKPTSIFTFGHGDDLICASQLSNYFGYDYSVLYSHIHGIKPNNLDVTATQTIEEYFSLRNSFVDGTYFEPNDGLTDSNVRLKDTIRLSGGAGEIISRPYVSFNMFESYNRTISKQDIQSYYNKKKKNRLLMDDTSSVDLALYYINFISEIIANSSFTTDILRNEEILLQRTRYHFDTQFNNSFRTPIWEPCQSKIAFRCYITSINMFCNRRFVFNLIEKLDKTSSLFPYANKKDNADSIRFRTDLKASSIQLNQVPDYNYEKMRELESQITISYPPGKHIEEWRTFDLKTYLESKIKSNYSKLRRSYTFKTIDNAIIGNSIDHIMKSGTTTIGLLHAWNRKIESILTVVQKPVKYVFDYYTPPSIECTMPINLIAPLDNKECEKIQLALDGNPVEQH